MTAGAGVEILAGGSARLRAGSSVALEDGFSVLDGGELRIELDGRLAG